MAAKVNDYKPAGALEVNIGVRGSAVGWNYGDFVAVASDSFSAESHMKPAKTVVVLFFS